MSSLLMKLQLLRLNWDAQRLDRSNGSYFSSFGVYSTRSAVGGRSSSTSKVHLPSTRDFDETSVRENCGGVAHQRVDAGGSDGESSRFRVSEGDRAAGQSSLNGSGNRSVAFTAVAVALSLLLHHGTASSTEAAAVASFLVSTFPWEKRQELVQPEPLKGSCATCIGVVDETLGTCNSTLNCISSFDDRPKFFVAPWEFPGQLPNAVKELKETLLSMGAEIVTEPEERYVHAVFTDKPDGVIDDVEFLFSKPLEDATVVIRAASRAQGVADNDRNRRRLEQIRATLTWEQVPVLRNRSRTLFFLESPWDSFGPEPPPTFDYNEGLELVPE